MSRRPFAGVIRRMLHLFRQRTAHPAEGAMKLLFRSTTATPVKRRRPSPCLSLRDTPLRCHRALPTGPKNAHSNTFNWGFQD